MILVTHEVVDGVIVGATTAELVPLEVDMLATFRTQKGRFFIPQEVVDSEDEDDLGRAMAAALERAGVSGRRVRLSHVKEEGGRLYTWRIISTWIRPYPGR